MNDLKVTDTKHTHKHNNNWLGGRRFFHHKIINLSNQEFTFFVRALLKLMDMTTFANEGCITGKGNKNIQSIVDSLPGDSRGCTKHTDNTKHTSLIVLQNNNYYS